MLQKFLRKNNQKKKNKIGLNQVIKTSIKNTMEVFYISNENHLHKLVGNQTEAMKSFGKNDSTDVSQGSFIIQNNEKLNLLFRKDAIGNYSVGKILNPPLSTNCFKVSSTGKIVTSVTEAKRGPFWQS